MMPSVAQPRGDPRNSSRCWFPVRNPAAISTDACPAVWGCLLRKSQQESLCVLDQQDPFGVAQDLGLVELRTLRILSVENLGGVQDFARLDRIEECDDLVRREESLQAPCRRETALPRTETIEA